MKLQKGEMVISYSNRIIELISKLGSEGPFISEIEKKRFLLRELTSDIDITAGVMMDSKSELS